LIRFVIVIVIAIPQLA